VTRGSPTSGLRDPLGNPSCGFLGWSDADFWPFNSLFPLFGHFAEVPDLSGSSFPSNCIARPEFSEIDLKVSIIDLAPIDLSLGVLGRVSYHFQDCARHLWQLVWVNRVILPPYG
jgi:hypothetical protein